VNAFPLTGGCPASITPGIEHDNRAADLPGLRLRKHAMRTTTSLAATQQMPWDIDRVFAPGQSPTARKLDGLQVELAVPAEMSG
jgi:hypothetical protein